MMTALSADDQRQRGERLGANRYLVKSQVGIEDVINTIHEVLGDKPVAAPAPAAPAPEAVPFPATAAAPAPAPEVAQAPVVPQAPVAPQAPVVPQAPAEPQVDNAQPANPAQ